MMEDTPTLASVKRATAVPRANHVKSGEQSGITGWERRVTPGVDTSATEGPFVETTQVPPGWELALTPFVVLRFALN
jgi:hypothetical protein